LSRANSSAHDLFTGQERANINGGPGRPGSSWSALNGDHRREANSFGLKTVPEHSRNSISAGKMQGDGESKEYNGEEKEFVHAIGRKRH
jgi:hypothetical protein